MNCIPKYFSHVISVSNKGEKITVKTKTKARTKTFPMHTVGGLSNLNISY